MSEDRGFTLVELMVVMLIVALLVTMGIAAFTTFSDRAQDRSAQADIRHAIIAEQANRSDYGEYTDKDNELSRFVPSLRSNKSKPSNDGVYVDLFSSDVVCLHQESKSGKVFSAYVAADEAVQFGEFADEATALGFSCNGTAPGWPTTGW